MRWKIPEADKPCFQLYVVLSTVMKLLLLPYSILTGCELFLRPQNRYCIYYPLVRYSVASSVIRLWVTNGSILYTLPSRPSLSSQLSHQTMGDQWILLYTLPPFSHLAAIPSIRSFIICHTQTVSHSVAVLNVNPHCICYPSVNHTVT